MTNLERPLSTIKQESFLSEETFKGFDIHEKHLIAQQMNWPSALLERLEELFTLERSKTFDWPSLNLQFVREENGVSWYKEGEEQAIPKLEIHEISELPLTFNKSTVYLAANKISGKLKLRKWEEGDRIASLGLKGTQLISDILKDAKVSLSMKHDVLVLCDDENIHWCIGYKVGRLAAANSDDEIILKIGLN